MNEHEYVELGLSCADICRALDRGMNGKKLEDLSQSVCEAINQLTTWVKPMMHGLDGLLMTMLLIAEQLRRYKGKLSNGANGTRSLDLCMRRTIRRRSLLGRWTSTGSFTSSMCV